MILFLAYMALCAVFYGVVWGLFAIMTMLFGRVLGLLATLLILVVA